jgi:peptide/nickel transport system substrate-binding protein
LNNHSEFCDPRVDRLARAAAKLEPSNPAAAARLWARADRRVTDAAPWVTLAQVVSTEVVSRRVGNFRFASTSGAMLSQLWVR